MPKDFFTNLSFWLKKILLGFLFTGAFVGGAAGSYFYLSASNVFVKNDPSFRHEISPTVITGDNLESSYNVLLLGYGGEGHDGGSLSDVLIVINIRPVEKKVSVISVPRDLWVEVPVRSDISESHKINAAYAIGGDDNKYPLKEPQYRGEAGGGRMAEKVVSHVVGMPVNYFIAVDFDGFKRIIDTLGGVIVDVPVAFEDRFYPVKGRENDTCGKTTAEIAKLHELFSDTQLHHQFECRYETIHFEKGKSQMDGETALKFVRSRSGTHGGDFARSQRQYVLLLAIKDKLISIGAVKKIDELFNQFSRMVRTDLDLVKVKQLADILGNLEDYTVKFIGLNEDNVLMSTKSFNGQFILIPKQGEGVWAGVHSFIQTELEKN